MADRVITLRIPEDVADQLDAYRQGLLERKGLEVSQHEAILSLIRLGLTRLEDDGRSSPRLALPHRMLPVEPGVQIRRGDALAINGQGRVCLAHPSDPSQSPPFDTAREDVSPAPPTSTPSHHTRG